MNEGGILVRHDDLIKISGDAFTPDHLIEPGLSSGDHMKSNGNGPLQKLLPTPS